jgi:antitoxin (DNA-binding transcriptional repressor) of toxin-antitoxin stability system
MRRISLQDASFCLPELIALADDGEAVVIVQENGKAFQIIPLNRPVPKFGSARGLIKMSEDFDEPIEDFADYMP